MEKYVDDKIMIVCFYEVNEFGDYVISVMWGNIEVCGLFFKVNL